MALHEKRCELCRDFFTNFGMSSKCLNTDSDSGRPLSPSDIAFINARGCATFNPGSPRENVIYTISFNDGITMREYGRVETAESADKLKEKMLSENFLAENIRIVQITSKAIELDQIALDAAAEIAAKTP